MLRYVVPRLPQVNINLQQLPSLHPVCPFQKRKERKLGQDFFITNRGQENFKSLQSHIVHHTSDDDDVDSAVDNYASTRATSSRYQPATALLLVRSRKVKRKKIENRAGAFFYTKRAHENFPFSPTYHALQLPRIEKKSLLKKSSPPNCISGRSFFSHQIRNEEIWAI